MLIRDATVDDIDAITDLFNALISTTTVAWRDEPSTVEEQRTWFLERQRLGFPTLVADDDGVIGYACWSSFRGGERFPGYRHTVEHTIHVRADRHRQGAGRLLLSALIARARENDIHVMVAGIDSDNQPSIALHEALGFVEVARMPQTGRKFGRWLDLVLMQLILDGQPD